MHRLVGSIQPYAWGDRRAIAAIQGREPSGEPEAELWLGAHPVAPSRLDDTGRTLLDAVDADPTTVLGPVVADRFGRLPFLLKILAAAEPLSIQAHPSLDRARAGFEREQANGVAWDAPERTYRDDNHKPEIICALTRFEAKCGFRDLPATLCLLDALAAASAPAEGGRPGDLETLTGILRGGTDPRRAVSDGLAWLLRLHPAEAEAVVADAARGAERLLARPLAAELAPFRSDLAWVDRLRAHYPGDAGVVVALLLNHVVLEPGEALFLEAGNLHSYLRGTGVELMANSDNVVRGGLTPKHVDVDELCAVVDTTPAAAPVQRPSGPVHTYATPVPDMSLTRLADSARAEFTPTGPEIVLVTAETGALGALAGGAPVTLGAGQAAFVAGTEGRYRVEVAEGGVAWRATVGSLR